METKETILFKNKFGMVTDKRVTLAYKSGDEDIPLNQITSVSLKHQRNYFFATLSFASSVFIIAILFSDKVSKLGALQGALFVVILIFLGLSGIANWIGHHNIIISSGGKDRKPLKVELAKTKEGREFVNKVNKALYIK